MPGHVTDDAQPTKHTFLCLCRNVIFSINEFPNSKISNSIPKQPSRIQMLRYVLNALRQTILWSSAAISAPCIYITIVWQGVATVCIETKFVMHTGRHTHARALLNNMLTRRHRPYDHLWQTVTHVTRNSFSIFCRIRWSETNVTRIQKE